MSTGLEAGFEGSEVPMPHSWNWREPSLAETLSDPVVRAVMAADAVDPAALAALLREAALRVESTLDPSRPAKSELLQIGAPH
jgi:hypothetical protein